MIADERLNRYIPHSTSSLLTRSTTSTALSSRLYGLSEPWNFAGEDGGPYLFRSSTRRPFSVTGVHVGGQTGCTGYGRKIDMAFARLIQNRLTSWTTESNWCNVIEDRVNIGESMASVWKGVSSTRSPAIWSAQTSIAKGSYFSSKLQLLNVGTIRAEPFKVTFHLHNLNRSETLYLGSQRVAIRPWSARVVRKGYLSTQKTTAGDYYRLVAGWQAGCLSSADPTTADIGILHIT